MASKPLKMKKLEKVAYHEAGHAVAAFLMRRSFSYVTIKPDESSFGHIFYQKFRDSFNPDYVEDYKIRRPLEKAIITGLAGHVAEKIYSKQENYETSENDFHVAVDLASYLCGSNEEIEAYIKWLYIRTKNMLEHPNNWCKVKAFAEELLDHRRIGYVKARKIMKDAVENSFQEYRKRSRAPK